MRNFLFLALLVFSNAILGQESSLLLSVNYPSNAFDVSPEMAKMIRAKVDSLQAEGDAITAVEIVSHTDSVGSFDYNQQLSSQRAEAMTHFLSTQCQIPKEAIVPRFYGFTQPIGEGEVNRRTEIHLH
ncbi:MAG: OmpA family protein, partial [Schleiferiaceae bacterium]|nr:OmpA family protein [Schleiferiaceae bacterium]